MPGIPENVFRNSVKHVIAGGTINATNNWWGTNDTPSSHISGDAITSPWLVMNVTATPASLTGSQTSLIRVNLTRNSAGIDIAGSGIFVPNGIPVTFRRTSGTGTLAPASGKISAGTNTSRFTPGGSGTSTIAVTVDSQTVSSPVTKVTNAPVANFSGTPRTGLYPLTVRFTDLSTNSPTSWK